MARIRSFTITNPIKIMIFTNTNTFLLIISALCVAAASGLIGSFLILRRMTLLSDALSHVALPGIALGVIFNFEPLVGGLLFLFLSIFLIWGIEYRTKLAIESITGVLFVTALAIGSLLIEEHELLEAFFGNVETVSSTRAVIQTILALIVLFTTALFFKRLMLVSVAPELALSEKIHQSRMELLLLALIALTISIGISFVGVLLMSALTIIPAAGARNISKNLKEYIFFSIVFAIIGLISGIAIAKMYAINSGIATVLISTSLFVISLFWKRNS